jgi:hypothetical protein
MVEKTEAEDCFDNAGFNAVELLENVSQNESNLVAGYLVGHHVGAGGCDEMLSRLDAHDVASACLVRRQAPTSVMGRDV